VGIGGSEGGRELGKVVLGASVAPCNLAWCQHELGETFRGWLKSFLMKGTRALHYCWLVGVIVVDVRVVVVVVVLVVIVGVVVVITVLRTLNNSIATDSIAYTVKVPALSRNTTCHLFLLVPTVPK
jgi:hypothetical protein